MSVEAMPTKVLGTIVGERTVVETSEEATPATVALPAPTVVDASVAGSLYQPANMYYQPTTVGYQSLPANYLPVTTYTITYPGAYVTPSTFTADAEDAKDEKVETSEEATPATITLPATAVVGTSVAGSFYQPANMYYQPTIVGYQSLSSNYLPVTASTITYQGALQNGSLLRDGTPSTFTADAEDAKDEKVETSEEATPATDALPATTVVDTNIAGSSYQPANMYYKPTTVGYQSLPANYLPVTTYTITYQGALQNDSLLKDGTPSTFTADAKDTKDEEATEEKKEVKAKKVAKRRSACC